MLSIGHDAVQVLSTLAASYCHKMILPSRPAVYICMTMRTYQPVRGPANGYALHIAVPVGALFMQFEPGKCRAAGRT